jgi:hypothetical protein
MGSAAFLLVYAAVNIGHMRIRSKTGAKAWLLVVSVITCLALFVVLSVKMIRSDPSSAIALAVTLSSAA